MKDRIGRYTIIRELGRGGMATVYLAHDPNFGRNVAIKVLPRQFLHDPQFRTRFTREAQTIAALEHPAIVPVYDFGEQDEQPYIVMRFMQGGDLAHKLENGALPLVQVATIVNRLAAALDSAHEKKIIHRDLKPGNILFDQYDNAYLSDFGIVKLKEQNATFTGNAIIGTPTYMSPEQAKGDKTIDGRSDLYALGVIIYEMLAGVVPYQGNTPVRQMMQHIMDPVPRILDTNANLPATVGQIVSRALAKDPDDRFATSAELAEELSFAAGLGSGAFRRPSQPHRQTPPRGTVLDNSVFDDDDEVWDEGASDPHTVLDKAAFDEPPMRYEPTLGGAHTVLDDAAFDDEPIGRETVFDDSEFDNAGVTVLGDSGEGYTFIDDSDAFGSELDGVDFGSSAENDDLFAAEPEPEPADDWFAAPPEPQRRPPPRRPKPKRGSESIPAPLPPAEKKKGPPVAYIIGGIVGLMIVIGGVLFALSGNGTSGVAATPTNVVAVVTDVPTDAPSTDVPPTDVPPTEIPVTDVPPSTYVPTAGDVGGGGSLIAFQTQQSGGWNIGVMNLDGSNRVILTDDTSNDMRPRWSPDGQWIIFRSDRSGNEDIWMMHPDGSELRQVTTQPLADHTATFSPDGTQLAYHADFDGEGIASIAIMPVEGGKPTRLTTLADDNSYWPNWSPDGKRLTFWTLRNDGNAELYIMDADGTNQRPLLKNGGAYLDAVWSPVSDEIAFYAYGSSGRAELFVISAETKQITPIETDIPSNNILSDWSPDGEWLLLHTDFHGADEIYMVRKDGSEQRRVTKTGSDDQHPVWQPINRVQQPIEPSAPAPISGELIVWHSLQGEPLEVVSRGFEQLQTTHSGLVISAEYIPSDQMQERYAAAAADGTAPDILFAPVDWGGDFLAKGFIQDPMPLLPDTAAQRIGATHLDNVRVGFDAVGVPFTAHGVVLMRNRTILPDAPTSFDEIVALGSKRYDLERGLYYSGATLNALGGQLMDTDGNPAFNNANGVAWLNTLTQFNDPHSYQDQDIVAFEQEQIGLVLEGTWNLGRLANEVGHQNLIIDPWPTGLSGYVMYETLYVRSDLKFEKRSLVTAFLADMLSEPLQTALAQRGQIPVVSDATVTIDHVTQAQAAFATSHPLPIQAEMAYYWEPLTNAINSVVDDGLDPAAALEAASAEIESDLP